MTEPTDREDIIPTRIGDLSDVDSGTAPAVGDTLTWDGTEWASARGDAALLPKFGPDLSFWKGDTPNANIEQAGLYGAFNAIEMAADDGYDGFPNGWTLEGTFTSDSNNQTWRPTNPGVYQWEARQYAWLSAAPHATANYFSGEVANYLELYMAGGESERRDATTVETDGATFWIFNTRTSGTLIASQGMIDAGYAGVGLASPDYVTAGTERIKLIKVNLATFRYSPGSTFNYFGDL